MVETSLNNFLEDTTFPYTVETKKDARAAAEVRADRSRMERCRAETEYLMTCRRAMLRQTENRAADQTEMLARAILTFTLWTVLTESLPEA